MVESCAADIPVWFDLGYRISSDYDFMLRALELQQARVRYIPHTLVDFMVGGMSTRGLGAVIRGNLECLKARRKHLGTPPVDLALFLKPAKKILVKGFFNGFRDVAAGLGDFLQILGQGASFLKVNQR